MGVNPIPVTPSWLVEGEQLTHSIGVADHQPDPDQQDEDVPSDLFFVLLYELEMQELQAISRH